MATLTGDLFIYLCWFALFNKSAPICLIWLVQINSKVKSMCVCVNYLYSLNKEEIKKHNEPNKWIFKYLVPCVKKQKKTPKPSKKTTVIFDYLIIISLFVNIKS